VRLERRFGYQWATGLVLRGEDVRIDNIDNPAERAPEIVLSEGHSSLTSVALEIRHDSTNPGLFKHTGTISTGRAEFYGALGGDYSFQKFETGFDHYRTLHEDLTERKTVLGLHGNAGFITGDSVFFERFYGGGLGSVRGFQFRGISPRAGTDEDAVGGEFALTGTAEVSFPLIGENLRGVVFDDAGTVERDMEIGTIRSASGPVSGSFCPSWATRCRWRSTSRTPMTKSARTTPRSSASRSGSHSKAFAGEG
jgi:outer membrane protein insertion porin family